jgi:hypothetical protein
MVCNTEEECKAWTYRSKDGWCWLRSAEGNHIADGTYTSGAKPEGAPVEEARFLYGFNLPSASYRNMRLKPDDPGMCEHVCNTEEKCLSWTSRPSDGHCWLRSGYGDPIKDGTYTSGKKPEGRPVEEPEYLFGQNLPAVSYRNFDLPQHDPSLCLEICDREEQCFSWTYRFHDGWCWLRSGFGVPNIDGTYTSGKKTDPMKRCVLFFSQCNYSGEQYSFCENSPKL